MKTAKDAQALLTASLALLETQGEVTLTLHGNCMWPTVRDGDLATIRKAPPESFRFGDVAVCNISDSGLHVYTQFMPSFLAISRKKKNKTLVGKVVRVNRNGRTIHLENRSLAKRLLDTLVSPVNPLFLWVYLRRLQYRLKPL